MAQIRNVYGKFSEYSAAKYANDVYYCTDYPFICAKGVWRAGYLSGTLKYDAVAAGSEDSAYQNPVLVLTPPAYTDASGMSVTPPLGTLEIDLSKIATTPEQRAKWDTAASTASSANSTAAEAKATADKAWSWIETTTDSTGTASVIDTFKDIENFLNGISDTSTLNGILAGFLKLSGGTMSGTLTSQSVVPSKASTYTLGTSSNKYSAVYADTFVGKLQDGATVGSSALPVFLSAGTVTACTGASLFPTLANSNNQLSITVAGQNRTLTVGYATSAGTAAKVGSTSVGSATQPVYLSNGTPTACTSYANAAVASAAKLTTARKIWGQSFNGTADISGALSGVTQLSGSSAIGVYQTGVAGTHLMLGNYSIKRTTGATADGTTDEESVVWASDLDSINSAISNYATLLTNLNTRVTAIEGNMEWVAASAS